MLLAEACRQSQTPAWELPDPPGTLDDCAPSHTLVVALGNPILGDDAVGWRVVELVKERGSWSGVEFAYLSAGGLDLMERMIGFERAIIVDAIRGRGEIGTVYTGRLEELTEPMLGHATSTHNTSLTSALELGRRMGAKLPERVEVVAVEAVTDFTFSEQLSPLVADALPEAAKALSAMLLACFNKEG